VPANVRTPNLLTDAQEFKNGTKKNANVNVQKASPKQHVVVVR